MSRMIAIFIAVFVLGGCARKGVQVGPPVKGETRSYQEQEEVEKVREGEGIQTISGMSERDTDEMKLEQMKRIEEEAKEIYFDFDKYDIRPDQEPRIDYDAKLFNREDAREFNIRVEGNCDEWGSDEYNYALGLKRAKSVRDALAIRGVSKERMSIISYGESNPVCTDHTPECWAKNRRVDFELIP